jgi:hypothetical protein
VLATDRFWPKVEKTESCWLWVGATTGKGYGTFWNEGRMVYAHRFAYESLVGPIPDGLQIDHLCRVKNCVNPEHMEPVTNAENTTRGDLHNRRKTHCRNCGHPLERRKAQGDRICRPCQEKSNQRYRARKRAARAARRAALHPQEGALPEQSEEEA